MNKLKKRLLVVDLEEPIAPMGISDAVGLGICHWVNAILHTKV